MKQTKTLEMKANITKRERNSCNFTFLNGFRKEAMVPPWTYISKFSNPVVQFITLSWDWYCLWLAEEPLKMPG